VKDTIRKCRQLLDGGDKGGFNNQKRKLPGFVFMSEIMPNTSPDKKGNPRPEDRWRVQESLHTVLKVLNRVFPKATVKVMRNNALEQDVKSWFAEVPASD
jgi:hypothetical protein